MDKQKSKGRPIGIIAKTYTEFLLTEIDPELLNRDKLVAVARRTVQRALDAERKCVLGELAARVDTTLKLLYGDSTSCRVCGDSVWWAKTKKGKRIPLDARGVVHFADCSGARQTSKRRAVFRDGRLQIVRER